MFSSILYKYCLSVIRENGSFKSLGLLKVCCMIPFLHFKIFTKRKIKEKPNQFVPYTKLITRAYYSSHRNTSNRMDIHV